MFMLKHKHVPSPPNRSQQVIINGCSQHAVCPYTFHTTPEPLPTDASLYKAASMHMRLCEACVPDLKCVRPQAIKCHAVPPPLAGNGGTYQRLDDAALNLPE